MISGFLDAPGTVRELRCLVHRTAVSLAVSSLRIFLLSSREDRLDASTAH